MTIRQTFQSEEISFYLNCANLSVDMMTSTKWELPGITLEIDGEMSKISAEMVSYKDLPNFITENRNLSSLVKVTCKMNEIRIEIQNH